ncbi:pyridoxal phosphate-dependent aminotransferase [Haladaptatus caseinilyticus]|uniref:pyridoxal phosphate-dependent aminotransferase n=1 Tax=Haladaptatus caseinilyticus TaxID=2993314 RepID=UPI00224A8358|nr:pyridoxal phosphate-dependent aminotransferase [Haladaptatus caseinilyticus]
MTREALAAGAINLSQGIPDEDETPNAVKEAAREAITANSQYTITWGLPKLRQQISEKYREWKGVEYDSETEVTVTCGTSEAVMSALLAFCGKGDKVLYFEPTYESYIPAINFAGAEGVPLDITEDLTLDVDELQTAARDASLLILNTPQNPTGKVFSRAELEIIADVAADENLIVVTDEIYEHIVFDDEYVSPVEVGNLADRTIICTGLSKTYSVTGWRVGIALAPEPLSRELRKIHDYTSICAPTPFQVAGVEAYSLPPEYYSGLRDSYRERRELLYDGLRDVGLNPVKPDGAYYMMVRYDTDEDDIAFAKKLVRRAGVATVPGSSFYTDGSADWIRFTFSRNEETLTQALNQLAEHRWW